MTTLVMLPGLDGTGRMFGELIGALGDGIDPVVISYPPDPSFDYPRLEAIVRESLPRGKPFYLLAESFSGPLAISIAATRPIGLRGLILSCSFATSPRPALARLQWLIACVPAHTFPRAVLSHFTLGRHASHARLDALEGAVSSVPTRVLGSRARAALSADVRSKLENVAIPILYLLATKDRIVTRTAAQIIVQHAPQTRIVEMDAPHLLLQSVPKEAAAHLLAFMHETDRLANG